MNFYPPTTTTRPLPPHHDLPVERERLREREREIRAQMIYEEQRGGGNGIGEDGITGPLFGQMVRVKPTNFERHQIFERNLGKYDDVVKHLIAESSDVTNFLGIDGHPTPPPPTIRSAYPAKPPSASSSQNPHEFKRPNLCSQPSQPNRSSSSSHHHRDHHSSSSQRGGFVKPADGKPPYSGRGFYPGQSSQSMKHSSSSMNDSRGCIVPGKGPPPSSMPVSSLPNHHSSSSSGRPGSHEFSGSSNVGVSNNGGPGNGMSMGSKMHANRSTLPKLLCEPLLPSIPSNGSSVASLANVENILDEMTSSVRTPLTAIAATPRKEMESKFTFNRKSGMMEEISPAAQPTQDKNTLGTNTLTNLLGPRGRLPTTPVFKSNPVTAPFLSPSASSSNFTVTGSSSALSSPSSALKAKNASTPTPTGGSSSSSGLDAAVASISTSSTSSSHNISVNSDSLNGIAAVGNNDIGAPTLASSATSSSKGSSITPTLEEDLSISEDSDGENYGNDDCEVSRKSLSNQPTAQKPETAGVTKSESSVKSPAMSSEEVHDSSSSASDDSESDSGSDSDDSSSDSTSPPALPAPVAPDLEDHKHQWNLKNFLPASHGNSTPAPQTPKVCENDGKLKTEDSDSSADTVQNARAASSSSSDSDSGDKRKSRSDDSSDAESDAGKGKYRSSSSSSSSSDDSDCSSVQKLNHSSSSTASVATANVCNTTANTNTSNSNLTMVGVVRPLKRKPPSPQVDERFAFVQQQQMQQTSLDSSQSNAATTMGRNRLGEEVFGTQQQRSSAAASGSAAAKSTENKTKTGRGRKPKSPARTATAAATAAEPPAKKRRGVGRKKTVTKVPEVTDSEDDEPKVKVPERKRPPGRPPLKRTHVDDDDEWTAGGSKRKMIDKFPPTNVWGKRERRRSSLRYSFTQDSDSDFEQPTPPVTSKPTARVQPVNKKKEQLAAQGSRTNRESSCESTKNDSDFSTPMNGSGSKSGLSKVEESPPKLDIEGATIPDKKKSDTLRKLFSRREEGGGKGGGKGKGGKGKCGVIIASEAEHKLLEKRFDVIQSGLPLPFLREPPPEPIGIPDDNPSTSTSTSSLRRKTVTTLVARSNASPAPVRTAAKPDLPKLIVGVNGKPSLMCCIDLSKIPFFLAKKRSEEMRTKSELSDTRQQQQQPQPCSSSSVAASAKKSKFDPPKLPARLLGPPKLDIVSVPSMLDPLSDNSDAESSVAAPAAAATTSSDRGEKHGGSKKHSKQKTKSNKRKHRSKEEPPPPIFTPTVHTPSVDPESDSDADPPKKLLCTASSRLRPQLDPMHNINSCYPMAVDGMQDGDLCPNRSPEDESLWPSNASNCSGCSCSPETHRSDKYSVTRCIRSSKEHSKRHNSRHKNRNAVDHMQRHSSLMDMAPPDPTLVGYTHCSEVITISPTIMHATHGIYYSYLEKKAAEEMNAESESGVSPNSFLLEAKRLKHTADKESDLVSQGMQYLEAILLFVLTGHVLERRNQTETAYSMYSETLKLIVYISKKFRTLCTNVTQSNIPNKIAILSLRCESILNLKLYMMREPETRDLHNLLTEYMDKPVEILPNGTPSPAGSNSSGYSSDRRNSSNYIAVPVHVHQNLNKHLAYFAQLMGTLNYWEEADKLIFASNKDFFIELDRFCGPLTLHSSLKDLVNYVRVGIQRLKAIINHHHNRVV